MPRSKRASRNYYVKVRVPRTVSKKLPSTIKLKQPLAYGPRQTIRIRARSIPTVTRRIKIITPKRIRSPRRGYLNVYQNRNLSIYSDHRAHRRATAERNRYRKRERKIRRAISRLTGQLHSVRRDRSGVMGANLGGRRTLGQLEAAAAIARYFGD